MARWFFGLGGKTLGQARRWEELDAAFRAVIAEDEPHARRSLREGLAGVDWIQLVGEAGGTAWKPC